MKVLLVEKQNTVTIEWKQESYGLPFMGNKSQTNRPCIYKVALNEISQRLSVFIQADCEIPSPLIMDSELQVYNICENWLLSSSHHTLCIYCYQHYCDCKLIVLFSVSVRYCWWRSVLCLARSESKTVCKPVFEFHSRELFTHNTMCKYCEP